MRFLLLIFLLTQLESEKKLLANNKIITSIITSMVCTKFVQHGSKSNRHWRLKSKGPVKFALRQDLRQDCGIRRCVLFSILRRTITGQLFLGKGQAVPIRRYWNIGNSSSRNAGRRLNRSLLQLPFQVHQCNRYIIEELFGGRFYTTAGH